MTNTLSPALQSLLLATNLGHSQNHPLAGWTVLSMLYRDGSTASEPMTLGYLVTRYNGEYLQPSEAPVTDDILRNVLNVLVEQAHLVTSSTRRVRERMNSGRFHTVQSAIYRISAAGIEYLRAMQRVVDAENTVVASTKRIGEYVQLLKQFRNYASQSVDTMGLYEDFNRLLDAYEAVMNGLRKLDVDLHEISSDLAFDRMGRAADHLRRMLHNEAIPAYQQMIDLAPLLEWLRNEPNFATMVAQSRQAQGNLDVAVALADQSALEIKRQQTAAFVTRRLNAMMQSFDPSTAAIQASFDSIYLLYQTLIASSELLAREYEHVRAHSIDTQALTAEIDKLLTQVQRLKVPDVLPPHLPMDRLSKAEMAVIATLPQDQRAEKMAELTATVRADMLEAGSMEPVTRSVTASERAVVTENDNPAVADDDADLAGRVATALAEFTDLVMVDANTARIDHDLDCHTSLARDAIVALYPATAYAKPEAFSAFGRQVTSAQVKTDAPIKVSLRGVGYVAVLPHGFEVTFQGDS